MQMSWGATAWLGQARFWAPIPRLSEIVDLPLGVSRSVLSSAIDCPPGACTSGANTWRETPPRLLSFVVVDPAGSRDFRVCST